MGFFLLGGAAISFIVWLLVGRWCLFFLQAIWQRGCSSHEEAEAKWVRISGLVRVAFWLPWWGIAFWFAGGRNFYYDAKIDHLCAVDGGIKVYETVKLPEDRFDKWGNINVHSEEYAKPTDEYFYRATDKHYQTGNPAIIRSVTQMIRRADGNLLGESIRYQRRGGNFALWIPTSYSCPPIKGLNLEAAIFKRDMK